MQKNYITKQGYEKLRSELNQLLDIERPKVVEVVSWAAGNGDRSENGDYIYGKKRLREIDSKIRFIRKRLEAAEAIDPSQVKSEKVLFGASVCIEHESGDTATYQIVGEDEINLEQGLISWKSPLAKCLLGKQVGDEVCLVKPKSKEYISILKLEYK